MRQPSRGEVKPMRSWGPLRPRANGTRIGKGRGYGEGKRGCMEGSENEERKEVGEMQQPYV